jgi:hypothetical protein
MMSIGLPRDHVGGSTAASAARKAAEGSGSATPANAAASADHAGAAAVGHDRERVVLVRAEARQCLGGEKQVLQGLDAEHAGAPERGVKDEIRRRQRTGVRRRCAHAVSGAAGLDHDHGLGARRGARHRHELARRLDRFDVEQDRARVRIARQVIEQVAEIDVEALADRDHVRKTDPARLGPNEHGGHQGPRLRDESDVACKRVGVREGGVEAEARRRQADAVRPKQTQQVRLRGAQRRSLFVGAETSSQDDRCTCAAPADLLDDRGDARRRRADDGQVRRLGQVGGAGEDRLAIERGVLWIDRAQRPAETRTAQVAPYGWHQRCCCDRSHRRRRPTSD